MDATFTTGKELQNRSRFGQLSFDDHEQIVFCNDKDTGLKAVLVFIVMGPA
jgi:leucine dehydrogenase